MADHIEKKKIVVLIDADNAQLSKLEAILEETAARGQIITKRAYGDWSKDTLKNLEYEFESFFEDLHPFL